MYISFWLKLQTDLLEKMTPQNWRWHQSASRTVPLNHLGSRSALRPGYPFCVSNWIANFLYFAAS